MSQKLKKNEIVITQVSHGSGDNIAGDKIINAPEHKVPIQLTSTLGNVNLIGRKKELQEIETLLNSSNTLLIKGIGGVGKSSISSYYLHLNKKNYTYYGFFEGLDSFLVELRASLDLKSEKDEDSFIEALSKLRKLEGDKLLVLDDVKDIEENKDKIKKISALKDSGYKIIFTSREDIQGMAQYPLDVLSIGDAKELFNSISKVEDELLLEEVLGYLDYHAFFIEKTAHSIKKTVTLEMIKEKFEKNEFSQISVKRKESFDKLLNQLFNFDGLDKEEVLSLKQLSILPSIEITFEFLQEIFDKKDDEEFEEILNYLCEKGWLGYSQNGYKLHQIIKEYILVNHLPTFEEIELEADFFYELIKNNDISIAITNKKNIIYLESLSIVFKRINFKNEKIANFYVALGHMYYHLGLYSKVETLYYTALEIRKVFIGENRLNISTIYNSLGNLFTARGDYEKVENLFFKALEIREKLLGINDYFTSVSYSDLASFYSKIELYEKAELFYLKSLEIRIFLYGEEDIRTAIIYKNIASLYQANGKNNKVEKLLLKALNIEKKVLNIESIAMCNTYKSLALFYESIADIEKAESLYKDALRIEEKLLGVTHPNVSTTYNNLAELYKLIGNFPVAEIYYLKSLDIQEKVFGDSHPNTATTYNNIALLFHYKKNYNKAYFYMKKSYIVWKDLLEEDNKKVVLTKNACLFFKEKIRTENLSIL